MKVAVTYENGEVFQHFGRTPQFKVYDIENGAITKSEVIDTNGTGHGALAGFLQNLKAEVLICGGIGGGAQMAMNEAGIRLFAGAAGDADAAVKAYLDGTLPENGEATCDHHDHEHEGEDHECGHGGCHH
ncbi:MAG: dinitrogenase iron-molybdenum cofactor biosynthesis protein [Lachnospiraceae bacterium]|nr:dinitrogenase iron-molybdenum cofactor biosynthesis protein [Lachnospiraceae bacterium]